MEELKRIGKYELQDYLGGGMSHVYKAWDTVMSRIVVVKIMTPASASDEEAKVRFLREAQTAGGLAHDNIIRMYDYGDEGGRPYMVMEYLQGQDLRESMRSGIVSDMRRRLEVARDSAAALEYIHSQNIVHRDIKPENIHIDQNGRVRLIDFGIAKRPEHNLTRAGFALGTPYYMAPEQVRGEDTTHLVDVYAFGILMFELFTGARPFDAEKIEQLFYKIMNDPIDLEPLRAGGVSEAVCGLVARCTAKAAADRPQSLAEARAVLESELSGGETAPPRVQDIGTPPERPAPGPRPSSYAKWGVVAAVAVIVLVLVGYFALREPTPPVADHLEEPAAAELTNVLATPSGNMRLVPAGEFLYGADRTPETLAAFYIDETEVTNSAYSRFCAETGHAVPPDFPNDRLGNPVVNITFDDAQAFAQWAGKRLPTAKEWEKAARGTDGRLYPWGAERDSARANVKTDDGPTADAALPAASFAFGASPFGALQMAGNVWEWVDEPHTPSDAALDHFGPLLSPRPTRDEPWYEIRGGSYDIPLVEHVTFEWVSVPARYRQTNIGFRCVRNAP